MRVKWDVRLNILVGENLVNSIIIMSDCTNPVIPMTGDIFEYTDKYDDVIYGKVVGRYFDFDGRNDTGEIIIKVEKT